MNMKKWPYLSLWLNAMCAGIILSCAGAASVYASAGFENASLSSLIQALVFPVGLLIICICKFKLYTGCCGACLCDNNGVGDYFGKLGTAWIANFFGAFTATCVLFMIGANRFEDKIILIAQSKMSMDFIELVILGIACNFLICLGIMMAEKLTCDFSAALILFLVVFLFVICKFEHSVANMFYLLYGWLASPDIKFFEIFRNLIPVSIGNLFGGVFAALIVGYNTKES